VKNAVEHGYDGHDDFTVSIGTGSENGRTQLRIADTGPGIPEGIRDEIFDRGTSTTGSGFGLFFVETMSTTTAEPSGSKPTTRPVPCSP